MGRSNYANFPLQSAAKMFLVLEFCAGGDLGQYVKRYGRVSENTARYFMHQLSEGLRELRQLNVLHVGPTRAVGSCCTNPV